MKVTFKGFDPKLGEKFAQESNGLVLGRGKQSRKKLTPAQKLQKAEEDSPFPLDAQQQHDAMMSDD